MKFNFRHTDFSFRDYLKGMDSLFEYRHMKQPKNGLSTSPTIAFPGGIKCYINISINSDEYLTPPVTVCLLNSDFTQLESSIPNYKCPSSLSPVVTIKTFRTHIPVASADLTTTIPVERNSDDLLTEKTAIEKSEKKENRDMQISSSLFKDDDEARMKSRNTHVIYDERGLYRNR